MKKILLLFLITLSVKAQYKIESIDLRKGDFGFNKDLYLMSFALDNNKIPNFSFVENFSTSKTTNKGHQKWGVLKFDGKLYNKILLPYEYNGFTFPKTFYIDKSNNFLIFSDEWISGYHIINNDNSLKSFLAYTDLKDIDYFKKTYPTVNILQQKYYFDLISEYFDGNELVSLGYGNIEKGSDEEFSLANFSAFDQKQITSFFDITNKKVNFKVGNQIPQWEPLKLKKSNTGTIWALHDGSFNQTVVEYSNSEANVFDLGVNYSAPKSINIDSKNGAFVVIQQSQKIKYILKDKINEIYEISKDGYFVGSDFQIDKNDILWFFNKETNNIEGINSSGKKFEVETKSYISGELIKMIKDDLNDRFWLLLSGDKLIKVSLENNSILTVNFSNSPNTPKENETITFKDESTGSPTSWAWDFGDGTSSADQNPQKIYSKAGKYKVILTVSKTGVESKSISKDITILDEAAPPPIERSIKITSPVSGTKVSALDPLNIKLELATGTILASCKVEIKSLNGSSLIKSLGNVNGALINSFPFSIKDVSTGEYWFKVSGVSQPNLKDSVKIQIQNVKFTSGVTLVTHGFQLFGEDATVDFVNGSTNQIGICAAIKKRIEAEGGRATIFRNDIDKSNWVKDSPEPYRDGDEIILFYNWSTVSNDLNDGALESAADNLFAMLADAKYSDQRFPSKLLDSNLPFHLIAHSRGNILMIQMLHRALKYFPNKKFEHFTLLDPHPATIMNDINNDKQQLSLPGVYGSASNYPDQPFLRLPSNVLKSDLYFRNTPQQFEPLIDQALFSKASTYLELGKLFLNVTAKANILDVNWDKLNGYYGNFSGINVLNSSLRLKLQEELLRNGASNKLPHTGVHEWYRGTILPESVDFSTPNRSEWYSGPLQLRTKFGYNLTRVSSGLSSLNAIENALNISDLDSRIVSRTGSGLLPIFNSNFQYSAKEVNFTDLIKTPSYYGFTGFGGISPDRIYVKKGRLELDNSRNKDGIQSQFVKHNFMFFPPKSNYLVIDVSSFKNNTFLAIEFYDLTNNDPIESKAFLLKQNGVYFVKIPNQLIGNTGTFRIKLSEKIKEHAVAINSITISEAEIVPNSQISFNWRNNEINSSKPIGVVADGTSKILINVELEDIELKLKAYKAEIKVSDADNKVFTSQYLGSVMPVKTTSQKSQPLAILHNSQLNVINDTKLEGGFVFEYQAPVDFSRPNDVFDDSETAIRDVLVSVNIYDIGQNLIQAYSKKLHIVRPPLILAHGLGGKGIGFEKGEDESTWRNFRYTNRFGGTDLFRYSNLFLVKRDINLLPTQSFDDNSDVLLGKSKESKMENESFDAMIKRMNDQGYACAKVDYVAHSMGGSVLRNTLEKPEYKNPKNYNQGYVNKFITICTPHQGSPLGDIMSEFTPYLSFSNDAFLSFLTPNLTGFVTGYFKRDPKAVEAVKNLSIRVENGGIRFNSSEIKNHLIFGNYVRKYDYDYKTLFASLSKDLKIGSSAIHHLTLAMALAAVRKFNLCNCESEKNEVLEIIRNNTVWQAQYKPTELALFEEFILKGEYLPSTIIIPSPNFLPEFYDWASRRVNPIAPEFYNYSDMVVSVLSQTAGEIPKFESNEIIKPKNSLTVFDDITHNFDPLKAAQSLKVGNRVLELLNSPINSDYFASSINASPIIKSPISCYSNCELTSKADEFNFSLSPNPTQNDFELDLSEMGILKEYQINIFDEKGTLMHTQLIKNNCCPTISPNINKPGVYSINIVSDQGIKTKKLIINK